MPGTASGSSGDQVAARQAMTSLIARKPFPDPMERSPRSPAAGIVDAHQHVWNIAAHDQPWLRLPGNEPLLRDFAETDLRPLADAAGVTATIAVQTIAEPRETPELLALAAASDLIAGVVGWVDLRSDSVADDLAELRDRPDGCFLRGIRHPVLIETDPGWLRRPATMRGLAAVAAAGLCYDIVVHARWLPAAVQAAAGCQELTFVLDHIGNPDLARRPGQAWVSAIRKLAAFPNTFCKLSGVLAEPPPAGGRVPAAAREASADEASQPRSQTVSVAHLEPYFDVVLDAFGPARLMFGSDWPPCTLSASYAHVVAVARALTASLSPAERSAIFAGTARRAYRLP